jgi:hypothetical protein
MDIQEVGWKSLVWIALAQDGEWGQVTGACEGCYDPLGSIKCGEFLDQLRTGKLLCSMELVREVRFMTEPLDHGKNSGQTTLHSYVPSNALNNQPQFLYRAQTISIDSYRSYGRNVQIQTPINQF